MERIALSWMLSIVYVEARNSGVFCHTDKAYSKIGRTIVTIPYSARELWVSKASFAFLIM